MPTTTSLGLARGVALVKFCLVVVFHYACRFCPSLEFTSVLHDFPNRTDRINSSDLPFLPCVPKSQPVKGRKQYVLGWDFWVCQFALLIWLVGVLDFPGAPPNIIWRDSRADWLAVQSIHASAVHEPLMFHQF